MTEQDQLEQYNEERMANAYHQEQQAEYEADCSHDHRCRYTHGFYCEDCDRFFSKESATYRSGEYLCMLWMACANVNAEALQAGKPEVVDAIKMRDKIGIGKKHEDYEGLIAEAEALLAKYGKTGESAMVILHR